MAHPELKLAIRLVLDEHPSISEYELIKTLQSEPFHFFQHFKLANEHQLFQIHFLVFNALFELQDEYDSCGQRLIIESISIRLIDDALTINQLLVPPDNKLKQYYLNLDNLKQTSQEDVESLLDSFWQRYYQESWHLVEDNSKLEALEYFGFEQLPTKSELKKAFKARCNSCHPDKGGSHTHFLELKRHYEMIKRMV